MLVGQVIELCRTCGFHIPAGADRCPGCTPISEPSLAARQVAGLALPTRSVHALSHVSPGREVEPRPIGRARVARAAFSFATALALITLWAWGLTWLASQPRFVLEVPDGTVDLLEDIGRLAAVASIVGLSVGLCAMVAWCVRASVRSWQRRAFRRAP